MCASARPKSSPAVCKPRACDSSQCTRFPSVRPRCRASLRHRRGQSGAGLVDDLSHFSCSSRSGAPRPAGTPPATSPGLSPADHQHGQRRHRHHPCPFVGKMPLPQRRGEVNQLVHQTGRPEAQAEGATTARPAGRTPRASRPPPRIASAPAILTWRFGFCLGHDRLPSGYSSAILCQLRPVQAFSSLRHFSPTISPAVAAAWWRERASGRPPTADAVGRFTQQQRPTQWGGVAG